MPRTSQSLSLIFNFGDTVNINRGKSKHGSFNMSQGSIRTARPQDLADIKNVIDATDLFPSELLDDMFSGDSEPGNQQEFWLVYEDSGSVAVAYCAPEQMANGVWNLLLIAVHPDRQGQGVGGQLMTRVEEVLRGMEIRLLLVETSGTDEFTKTRHFYEQIGYEQEACIRDYYDVGDDKVVFRKQL